jgi:hypothetical protein
MVVRVIYLTVRYYLATVISLIVLYVIFVAYLHVNGTLLFLLTIFIAWLQPIIDRAREIRRQLEAEESRVGEGTEATTTDRGINLKADLSWVVRPMLLIAGILLLLAIATYIYLFIRLRHWL